MQSQRDTWHRIRYAYHEAGHAVVAHILGRLIAEVSILADWQSGYKGYCKFDALTESTHGKFQWQKHSRNPELITIKYAGTIAMSIICRKRGWNYERWRGCDRADFDYIYLWSLEAFDSDEQRLRVQKACREQAREIIERYWYVVDELAASLLEKGVLSGREVYQIIRQAMGETGFDWRLEAYGIRG
jgi:ATP-dependent Zn protease